MEETNNEVLGTTEVTQQPEQPRQESSHDRNLVAMRKKLEEEEKARKEAERRADEAERRSTSNSQGDFNPRGGVDGSGSYNTEEEDLGLDPEDYMQNKQYQKANKKIHGKLTATEQKMAAMEQKLAYFEAKVETDSIKDFNDIVTDDNIKTFARLYPDDHEAVMSNPNFKLRAKTMYNMIKNYGVAGTNTNDTDERIAKNRSKPGNSSSTSPQQPQTPLTRLGDYERRTLTDADRDRVMKELERKRGSY